MKESILRAGLAIFALGAWTLCLFAAKPAVEANPVRAGGEVLTVTLKPTATATGTAVVVSDVASLQGGTTDQVRRVGALDLADTPPAGKNVVLPRAEVAFRLQLAGLDKRLFRVEGADKVTVSAAGGGITEARVVDAARQCLVGRLPWPAETVHIQVARSPRLPQLVIQADDQVRLEGEMRSSGSLVGRIFVDVAVIVNGQRRAQVPVGLDIKLSQQLAVATRRIEAGEALTKDNLKQTPRTVDPSGNYALFPDCVAGKRAKRMIPAGQYLTKMDLDRVETDHPILVKQRDLVKIVARIGPMRVIALGEALQDGSSGQLIRVRNVDSKNIIMGQVVDRSRVEVNY